MQRSDQWHEETKRIRSSAEQYIHGRWMMYVKATKEMMNSGEALVGMKRRGNQLKYRMDY